MQKLCYTGSMKQAVLGATGDVGGLLLRELVARGIGVRALSRSLPVNQLPGVEYAVADAEDCDRLIAATKDVDVLYITLSVPYSTEIWQQKWPMIMRNLIDAAQVTGCKLVFLDNVYMYGKVIGPMTEETPLNPASKKGEVRAEIAARLQAAIKSGRVRGVIGRSADFYGPSSRISGRFFQGTLTEGKAYWMGRPNVLRTWNYTPDNARALAILGNDERATGEVWHLPAAPAITGNEFVALAAKVLGRELQVVPLPGDSDKDRVEFAKQMPELAEMMYQYDNDYVFDSSKFQAVFGMSPTPYEDGFRDVYEMLKS